MSCMKFLLILLLALPCVGQSMRVEYDKFAKETTVMFTAFVPSTNEHLPLRMTVAVSLGKTREYLFLLSSNNRNVLYNRETLRLLIDGQLMDIRSTDIGDQVSIRPTSVQFKRIANAKTVELQLQLFEGRLSSDTLKRLKNITTLQ
jgi:hypothetical protein